MEGEGVEEFREFGGIWRSLEEVWEEDFERRMKKKAKRERWKIKKLGRRKSFSIKENASYPN